MPNDPGNIVANRESQDAFDARTPKFTPQSEEDFFGDGGAQQPAQAPAARTLSTVGPTPSTVGAVRDSVTAYAKDWYNSFDKARHMDLDNAGVPEYAEFAGHVLKSLEPIMAPWAMVGSIAAGTAARRAGYSDEDVKKAESTGGLIGGAAHIVKDIPGMLRGASKLSIALGLARDVGEGASDETYAAAKAYLEPLRDKLAKNPTAMAAVERAATEKYGADVVQQILHGVEPPPQVAFPTGWKDAAANFIQPIAKKGVGAMVGAGLGHLMGGHDVVSALGGGGLFGALEAGKIPGSTQAARYLTRAALNPSATRAILKGAPDAADTLLGGSNAGAAENAPLQPADVGGLVSQTPQPRKLQPKTGTVGQGSEGLSKEDASAATGGGKVVIMGGDGRFHVVDK